LKSHFGKKKNIACLVLFTEENLESEKQSLYDSKEGLKGVNSERLNKKGYFLFYF